MDTSKPVTIERVIAATDAELATLQTRHLLALHHEFSLVLLHDWRQAEHGWQDDPSPDRWRAIERLKAILDTRPHVPNKTEAKKARQLAAKRKR